MLTAELVYFEGAHFAHIVAYDEKRRLDAKRREAQKAYAMYERRNPRYGRP